MSNKYLFFILVISMLSFSKVVKAQKLDSTNVYWDNSIGIDFLQRIYLNTSFQITLKNNLLIQTQTTGAFSPLSISRVVDLNTEIIDSRSRSFSQRFLFGYEFKNKRVSQAISGYIAPTYFQLDERLNAFSNNMPMLIKNKTWYLDYGLNYSLKWGNLNKRYFVTQLNIPLALIPDNLMNISLNIGMGFKINRN